ncbi:dGTP triphosphohydrolase [Clostridium felsineum]|uniref:Deoxyguanosinetriphosphate triphosphohydrolase n=1 Tax=Clostridium felsineum TaxID=36839 RepID=A0A1S8L3L4_9CLOT|nr:dNTP triphosphohydrolase [Clostridium felsineum]URZ08956.1 Deoxyguanosinetriphosphate triphosphohydrolase [Clostridium felsineum]URZ09584.1 Deoxyguanosinetriphosphate triphosphohydrolase [Clostridium felsineum]
MEHKLQWEKLLCGKRERPSTASNNHRNEFDKDYDRIVYSSSIRRLQDKAQVFPLQENDFTRTRLTHSIEVSALAKSLGMSIGEILRKNKEMDEKQERELASLLQVSGLVHDLGNPPFGHYGEQIIRNWFEKEYKKEESILRNIEGIEKTDFTNFDGNAQTFRILTKLQLLNDHNGANFSYATLATIMKYPWDSFNNKCIEHEGKFGYFSSEKDIVGRIRECTGLESGVRHPATFLLEAADDMAYLCADIEDAVKKRIIPWDKEYKKIKDSLKREEYNTYKEMFRKIDENNMIASNNKIPEEDLISVQNFKISAQGLMIRCVVDEFMSKYDYIMNGKYECNELLDNSKAKLLKKELKRLEKSYCYSNKEVLTLELAGDNVINGLLDRFVNELANCSENPEKNIKERFGKLYQLISENFRHVCLYDYQEKSIKDDFTKTKTYDRLLLITDFISGMTDSYAVKLYKELRGIKLP